MKYSILFAIGLALILPLQAAGKHGRGKAKPKASPERVFKKKDKDNDQMLTKEEFTSKAKDSAKAGKRFEKLDKNSDGKLTFAEFSAKKGGAARHGKKAHKGAAKHGKKGGRKGRK